MKKSLPLLTLLCLTISTVFAQHYTISVQAGGNTMFLPKFNNTYFYSQGSYNPFELGPNDNYVRGFVMQETRIEKKPGFFVDVHLERKLANNWSLGATAGIQQINFSYNNFFGKDSTVKDINHTYGDTKLTYITSKIATITKKWRSVSLSAGPELSYLVDSRYINRLQYTTNNQPAVITEQRGDAKKLLLGATVAAKYNFTPKMYLLLGVQKTFSSLYKKEATDTDVHKKNRPVTAALGIGYQLGQF